MNRKGWILCLLLCLLGVIAQIASAQLAWDPKEFMGEEEIVPGMVGYGKTVYQGTKVEQFEIEVIGVLKKVDFGFDMILIRVTSGPVVDRKLQTVEGMSGSPIYINDRLIGAYAYGWEFQQEAIAGVTPIANMLECTKPGSVVPPLVGSLVPLDKVLKIGNQVITRISVAANHADASKLRATLDPTTMVLTPVATPVFVSGMPDSALKPLQTLFDRYNMRAEPGPGVMEGQEAKLEPGSACAVSLMEGDANLAGVGTVTYVKGDTILAFGHPFFGLGKVDLPLAPAYVHGILSSAQASFKLASPLARCGSITSDRQFAIGGTIGRMPDMLPVSLYLTDKSRDFTRRYAVNMLNNPDISPYILYLLVMMHASSQLGDMTWAEGTFTARTVVSTDKLGNIEQNLVVAPRASASMLPMGELYFLTDTLMLNPYEPVKITNVFIDMKYDPTRATASIEKVMPDRPIARPGEDVNFTVKIRPYGGQVETKTVTVKVPANATEPAMLVVVAGGTAGMLLKPFVTPFPAAEEGVRGLVRWLTDNPSSRTILTAQMFPSPSYGYRGHMLRDLPAPVLDVLRFAEFGGAMRGGNLGGGGGPGGGAGGEEERDSLGGEGILPTSYLFKQDVPYVLTGGQLVMIAIDTEERAVQAQQSGFDFGLQIPVLSASQTAGNPGAAPEEGPGRKGTEQYVSLPWLTAQQRIRGKMLIDALHMPPPSTAPSFVPVFHLQHPFNDAFPLSLALSIPARSADDRQGAPPPPQPPRAGEDKGGSGHAEENPEEASGENARDEGAENAPEESEHATSDNVLMTHPLPSWGLTDRRDFLRGKHLGTGVTSKGRLLLVPAVRAVFETTNMVPWKMVTTASGVYLVGWNSNKLMRLTDDGKGEVIFPRQESDGIAVTAITALAADAAGNLLIGSWPDQHVRMLRADGSLAHDWQLPGTNIWDLAVGTDGKRYAACDQGTVYLLRDDADAPLQVACVVPDKQVFVLLPAPQGGIYLGTSPRGKVYRLSADGRFTSVYETRGAVTSLAIDKQNNLYVGTSPTCHVVRVSPDGLQQDIMVGMGRGNRHVLSLEMIGDDLYAATGPAGGIYRISGPAGQEPEATPIFAREDLRDGDDEQAATGPEAVMVNALAVNSKGDLLAATSSPSLVLKLEPRAQGAFLSAVAQTPAISHWGQLDTQITRLPGQTVTVETRSGSTAIPDTTWGAWETLNVDSHKLSSDPAIFAQFRVKMAGAETSSPVLDYARLYYQPLNRYPVVKIEQPKAGTMWNGIKDIRWHGADPDGDQLSYTVFISRDDGKTWTQLTRVTGNEEPKTPAGGMAPKKGMPPSPNGKSPATHPDAKTGKDTPVTAQPAPREALPKPAQPAKPGEKPAAGNAGAEGKAAQKGEPEKHKVETETHENGIPWDSRSVEDGIYRLKVVASDEYIHPDHPRFVQNISGRFTVDNTPPIIELEDQVYGFDAISHVQIIDKVTPIVGGRFNIDGGPWIALVSADGIFDSKQVIALLIVPDGPPNLTPGDHKVTIQAKDAAGNVVDRTITLVIGEKAPPPKAHVKIPPIGESSEKDLADLMLFSITDP